MRDERLYADMPVAPLHGVSLCQEAFHGLRFCRSYRAPLDVVMERWTDPLLRQAWLKPEKTEFAITHAAPAYLEAMETDGAYAVLSVITFEDDGEFTTISIHATPAAPLTTSALIASGYADRWEERLYRIADILVGEAPCPLSHTENP